MREDTQNPTEHRQQGQALLSHQLVACLDAVGTTPCQEDSDRLTKRGAFLGIEKQGASGCTETCGCRGTDLTPQLVQQQRTAPAFGTQHPAHSAMATVPLTGILTRPRAPALRDRRPGASLGTACAGRPRRGCRGGLGTASGSRGLPQAGTRWGEVQASGRAGGRGGPRGWSRGADTAPSKAAYG